METDAKRELDRLKGRFLSSLNHEMRTPLTGIMGMAELLRETSLSPEQAEYVSIIRSCSETLNEVLNTTLEFASLSSGRAHREDAPFELLPCLEAMVTEYSRKAQGKGLEFFFRAQGYLPEVVLGDEIRLRGLLSQLLSNAVKFTATGKVELSVTGRGGTGGPDWLDIEVLDTGIGIAPEKLGAIFESFHPADTHDAGIVQQHAGLGLGLALARELVRLLDGEITAVSSATALGGSIFRLRLPLHVVSDRTRARAATPSAAVVVNPQRARILLVEDNRVSQRIVAHMLDRADFDPVTVGNGMDAVRLAHQERFALVLMDLQLPGIDGIETTHRLRRIAGYSAVPVVALTANAGDEFRDLCREHGFQGFLSKPVQAEELVRSIEECLMAHAVA